MTLASPNETKVFLAYPKVSPTFTNSCMTFSALHFHDSEREMGCSRCLKRPDVFQVDRRWAQVIEEANALTQEHMGNAHMQFVEQPRLQGLLDGACTMQGHIFLACELLCFRNRAFNTIGPKVKERLDLFHGFSGLRVQDNHWAGDRRAIRHDPSLLT